MKLTDLKKNLNKLSKEELIRLLVELYKNNQKNKELIGSKFDPNVEIIVFEKYREEIVEEFFPSSGQPEYPRYSNLRRALKNFKDISSDPELTADLMITHVEKGVEFTNTYGDIDEKFYDNIERTFLNLLKHLSKHDLLTEYKYRCLEIVTETNDIGWGFHDEITDLYYEFY
jgi:hypothetical protein